MTLSLSTVALENKCVPTSLALVQISFPDLYPLQIRSHHENEIPYLISLGKSNLKQYDAYTVGTTRYVVCIKSFWGALWKCFPIGNSLTSHFAEMAHPRSPFPMLIRTGPQYHI